ncbi:NfeD family protein [Saxibacter everestensis]|uniref:NfeD family protein n=1 Tax=Saxibacter everestensis TaxID=2909229 RepID=A0ABY8QS29_9MICO|nr:NfeD family protein [Brevibacteriaceae bacterium ZFBP1038]
MSDNSWAVWLAMIVVLGGIELVTLDLLFAMLAVGAIGGLLADVMGAPLPVEIGVAGVVAIGMIFAVRPVALKHLRKGPALQRTNADALLGASAIAIESVTSSAGLVRIGGDVWTARVLESDDVIEPDEKVYVARIDGATAVVSRDEVV